MTRRRFPRGAALAAAAVALVALASSAEPAPEGEAAARARQDASSPGLPLLDSLEAAQRGVRDLSARFRQLQFITAFEETIATSGEIFFRKPGSLLVRYAAPDTSLLSVNDSTVVLYYPELEQAHRFRVGEESTVSALLIGFGGSFREAGRHFRWSEEKSQGGRRVLRAEPRPESPVAQDLEEILLVVDPKTWLPVETRFRESTGDETLFRFETVRRNPSLPDSLFAALPPAGTTIIDMKP